MLNAALFTFNYLVGSIPFGFLVAYLVKKIDIRKFGSGNIGATNVFRVVGKRWGILVFILDFLKGFLPLFLVNFFFKGIQSQVFMGMAVSSVCGHNWPIFLKFKGGKGVAVSLGVVAGLGLVFSYLGIILVLSLCVWTIIFFIFRYVSLASILSGFIFFMLSLFFPLPTQIKLLSFLLLIFILMRHRKNISNLFQGKEWRF